VRRLLALIAGILACAIAIVAFAIWRGVIVVPFRLGRAGHALILRPNRELAAQLRDRGTVAVVGGVPLGVARDEATFVSYESILPLNNVLESRDLAAAGPAFSSAHLDGLLVRTDDARGVPGTVRRRLEDMRAVPALSATYLDDVAALYESSERLAIDPAEATRLISVVRLILQGAVPPPERLFSDVVRRSRPTEVAVIIRDGHEPVLWRAVRGGSIARALIDATYAVLDRWSTRQQQHYGPLRDAMRSHEITIALFYDRGTLGERTDEFLRHAIDPHVYSLGFELLGRWEYALPPTPWSTLGDPVQALTSLVREHDVPPPGFRRPELTLYRFRAYQIIEDEPQGRVEIFDPS
jgi:hypothetical protein